MKFILISLIFIGLGIVLVGYVRSQKECPPTKIEYRYVPRTFVEEQEDPTPVSEIFAKMFIEPSPWIGHSGGKMGPPTLRGEDINRLYISQS